MLKEFGIIKKTTTKETIKTKIKFMQYKLGKLPARKDFRTLKLSNYLPKILPPRPNKRVWSDVVDNWMMLANDKYGDCTCASIMHMLRLWWAQNGIYISPTDKDALSLYSNVTGFNPNDPSTDNGANELDILNYCRQNDVCGTRIVSAYADIDIHIPKTTIEQICASINLFGGIYVGASIYQSAMDEFNAGKPWKRTTCQGTYLGGHAFPIVDYDDDAQEGIVITWGKPQRVTYAWMLKNVDEGHAIYSPTWKNNNGITPSGFNETQLIEDLNEITK